MKTTNSQERIKQIIEYYSMTQTEFCQKTGITSSALSNYLHGDREPRQDKIAAIADAFDLDAAWVMGYDVPMKKKIEQTDRLLTYYKKLCGLKSSDQELIFNQIDYLTDRKLNIERKENNESNE